MDEEELKVRIIIRTKLEKFNPGESEPAEVIETEEELNGHHDERPR